MTHRLCWPLRALLQGGGRWETLTSSVTLDKPPHHWCLSLLFRAMGILIITFSTELLQGLNDKHIQSSEKVHSEHMINVGYHSRYSSLLEEALENHCNCVRSAKRIRSGGTKGEEKGEDTHSVICLTRLPQGVRWFHVHHKNYLGAWIHFLSVSMKITPKNLLKL